MLVYHVPIIFPSCSIMSPAFPFPIMFHQFSIHHPGKLIPMETTPAPGALRSHPAPLHPSARRPSWPGQSRWWPRARAPAAAIGFLKEIGQ